MTTSGPCAGSQCLAGYEHNLLNNFGLVARTENQNPHGSQVCYGPITSNPPLSSVQHFKVEANARNDTHRMAEQRVYWREDGGERNCWQE